MRFFVSFLLFSAFAFAELREVEVTWKANELFDIGNGTIVRVSCGEYQCESGYCRERNCYGDCGDYSNSGGEWKWIDYGDKVRGYNGKAYFEDEKDYKSLIFDDITCNVVKVFNNKQN